MATATRSTSLSDPAVRAKAMEARRAAHAQRQASSLRRDFADATIWEQLAHARRVRLPAWGSAPTRASMLRWLHRLGISLSDYRAWVGFKEIEAWPRANPTWPLRAWVGLLLEWRAREAPSC